MNEEVLTEVNGCLPKVAGTWRTFLNALAHGHRVHPTDPLAPKDCEFIVIDSKIEIRVIHLIPGNPKKSQFTNRISHFDVSALSKRSSLSEEYWFMKWNKQLKIGVCNCSFRRSLRYSVISNQPLNESVEKKRESSCVDAPPTKIKNVDTFVERLIQETIFEAFYEYYVLKSKDIGAVNLAFESTEDDVILRNKYKPNGLLKPQVTSETNNRLNRSSINSLNQYCTHRSVTKKPLVMLLHGIGSSADVWALIMNALVSKGYEVVAPDLLGHGYSSAPTKANYYTFNNLLLQALTIFDHYVDNDRRKCILIGHSYGCSLITAMYPHRAPQISQIILISGGGPTPLAPPVKENEIPPFGCIYTFLHPLFYCGVKRSLFYSSRGKHFQACDSQNGLPHHVLENIANGQKWSEGDAAFHRRILVPTLLVHGLQDKSVTLVQECEMERTMPRAFLELIPNAAHMPMIETPEHLIHMILCFLEMWN